MAQGYTGTRAYTLQYSFVTECDYEWLLLMDCNYDNELPAITSHSLISHSRTQKDSLIGFPLKVCYSYSLFPASPRKGKLAEEVTT